LDVVILLGPDLKFSDLLLLPDVAAWARARNEKEGLTREIAHALLSAPTIEVVKRPKKRPGKRL
jgi:hypothetical protein